MLQRPLLLLPLYISGCSAALVLREPSRLGSFRGLVNATEAEVATVARPLVDLVEKKLEYELHFTRLPEEVPKVNKVILVLLSTILGCLGLDRCYLASYCTGMLKGLTLGGLGIWAAIDFLIVVANGLAGSPDITVFSMRADFEEMSIKPAKIVAMVCLAYQLIQCLYIFTQQGKKKAAAVRDNSVAHMPTLVSKALRKAKLLKVTPSLPELRVLFAALDKDSNGYLDKAELQSGLERIGCSEEAIEKMIKQVDLDSDGRVSLSEFLEAHGGPA